MLKKFLYILWISIFAVLLFFSVKNGSFFSFIGSMENRTFDIRQNLSANSGVRHHNKDIVIVAIDDGSYEYILDKYGEWPLRRDMYAKMVDYIEAQQPKTVAFDLMFVKSMKSDIESDNALINVFKKYDNVYTSMNLDNQPEDLRIPPQLPEKLTVKPYPNVKDTIEYSNCRVILQGILDATSNIGMINVSRSDDGVLREMPLYLKYNGKYYPQLGYRVALASGNVKNVQPNEDASVILNWYGPAGTFENISMYKLLKAVENNDIKAFDFHNKIVYFGATAASLFDIKTVPVDKVYPGVEVQATYVNNLLDGSLIKQCPEYVNILAGLLLALLTVIFVMKIQSMPTAFGLSVTISAFYVMFAYELMRFKYYWIKIVSPLSIVLFAFILAVIVKYLIKSRDFDTQYKLATTDGLTELYNHRYFQEQMQRFASHSDRYNTVFSLIIIDIDFFKKFNDNFGHQSGDAVLRQVAFALKKNVRATDIVCRYGGEEMSIILPNTKNEEAVAIANKLCTIIGTKKCKLANGKESNVTISLGVSTYGEEDGLTPTELIASADKRLYHAKENGRNRVN
ncbi:MAG: diguanylate cyclase [Candidatus Gastranaerophilaceae bacterium]|jgi:diguanylate cyclase (GGDEF)-like protein|nr:diguanylate cyclase [Cyanobacteriota bacterium]